MSAVDDFNNCFRAEVGREIDAEVFEPFRKFVLWWNAHSASKIVKFISTLIRSTKGVIEPAHSVAGKALVSFLIGIGVTSVVREAIVVVGFVCFFVEEAAIWNAMLIAHDCLKRLGLD